MHKANHADDQTQAGDAGRNPAEEFMQPMGLTQGALAKAMGVQRKHVNELCNDRRTVTARPCLFWPACWQQRGFLAQCAAAQRSLEGDELAAGAQTD